MFDTIVKEIESKEDEYKRKARDNVCKDTKHCSKLLEDKRELERKIADLEYQILNMKKSYTHVPTPQFETIREENNLSRSTDKSTREMELYKEIEILKIHLEKAQSKSGENEAVRENKLLKQTIDDILSKNNLLQERIEEQEKLIAKLSTNTARFNESHREKYKFEIEDVKAQLQQEKTKTQESIGLLTTENESLKAQKSKMKEEWAEIYATLKADIEHFKKGIL